MKKLFSVILAVFILIMSVPSVFSLNSYEDYYYTENEDGTIKITSFKSRTAQSAVIPEKINGKSVTVIGTNAFKNRSALKAVTVPDSVISIENYAFYGCHELNSVVMGNGIKVLGSHIFNLCTSLTYINLKSVKEIGSFCFYNCTSLQNVDFSDKLISIGEKAFYKCTALQNADFPDSVKRIEDYAFYSCTSLTSLDFPNSLEYIGNSAFCGDKLISSVTFGNGELEIGGYAFENCPEITELVFPKTITKIGRNAFSNREETTVSYSKMNITCYSHTAGYAYSFTVNAKPYVADLNKKITPGDIDGKKGVTVEDARHALRVAAELEEFNTDEEFAVSDVNGNNTADSEDAVMILQMALGIYKA